MRKKVIAGNWKMNLNLHQSQKLVSEIIMDWEKTIKQKCGLSAI